MLQKLLNTEELSYSSRLNEKRLRGKINELFKQRNLRVEGRLISESEFTVYDRWTIISWDMPNLKRKAAYLKGKIINGENGIVLKLTANPNSFLSYFAILSTLIGVVTLLSLSYTSDVEFFRIFGLVSLVLGAIYYSVSSLLRNHLRNIVVKYLDLTKV